MVQMCRIRQPQLLLLTTHNISIAPCPLHWLTALYNPTQNIQHDENMKQAHSTKFTAEREKRKKKKKQISIKIPKLQRVFTPWTSTRIHWPRTGLKAHATLFSLFSVCSWCLLISVNVRNFSAGLDTFFFSFPLPPRVLCFNGHVYFVLDCKVLWVNAMGKAL